MSERRPEITCNHRIFRCLKYGSAVSCHLSATGVCVSWNSECPCSGSNSGLLSIPVPGTSAPVRWQLAVPSASVPTGSHMRWEPRAVRLHQAASFREPLSVCPEAESSQAATFHQHQTSRCTQPPSRHPQPSRSARANFPGNDPDSEAPALEIREGPQSPPYRPWIRTKMRRCAQFVGTSLAKAASRIGEAQF